LSESEGGGREECPVTLKTGFIAQLLPDALGGFEDDVEIILLDQLGTAGA
jgi:hypothetical protein